MGSHHVCNWKGCERQGRHYRDITLGGLPNIWMLCDSCIVDFDRSHQQGKERGMTDDEILDAAMVEAAEMTAADGMSLIRLEQLITAGLKAARPLIERKLLEEMREPSEAMLEAAMETEKPEPIYCGHLIQHYWQAMLDAFEKESHAKRGCEASREGQKSEG